MRARSAWALALAAALALGGTASVASATDPVAVVALLKELGASEKLATLIEGESLCNDASAVVLFKSVVGTGLFALPPAIRSAGWALGSAVMLLLAAVTVYTLQIIILGVREVRRVDVDAAVAPNETEELED